MSNTNDETTYVYEGYFKCSSLGEVCLDENVCGSDGSKLPEVLVIPKKVDTIDVTSFAVGMFNENQYVKEIILPTEVEEIPQDFCRKAHNLRSIRGADGNMDHIKHIGAAAFMETRLKEARFPNLEALETKGDNLGGAFNGCAYLEVVDIGEVTSIPERTFTNCALLREVIWTPAETEAEKTEEEAGETAKFVIGPRAFSQTRSLVDFRFLEEVDRENVDVQPDAFFYSKIGISWLTDDHKAFPTEADKKFWKTVNFTPCENRIVTKLSQVNSDWTEKNFLTNYGIKYYMGCALFAVMHIHSAITGKRYNHPDEFVEELRNDPELSRFLYYGNWPGQFKNTASMFEALGYRTEVHGNGSKLSKENFQALLDALAQGAYVYSQVYTLKNWEEDLKASQNETEEQVQEDDDYDGGHAVVLYGVNDKNEVLVLDSNVLHESFRDGGFDPDIDIYTYAMPYQKMVGPTSDFIIVYPPEKCTCR